MTVCDRASNRHFNVETAFTDRRIPNGCYTRPRPSFQFLHLMRSSFGSLWLQELVIDDVESKQTHTDFDT